MKVVCSTDSFCYLINTNFLRAMLLLMLVGAMQISGLKLGEKIPYSYLCNDGATYR